MEHCEDQHGTIIFIRAVQGQSHVVGINPNRFSLKEIPTSWKEHIFHTGSSSNYKSILENGLWAGGLSLRSTRQACFFSLPNPQESSSRQLTIDWKGPDHEASMVLYKHRNRPDHDCISSFNPRRVQDASSVFHQSSSDAIILYDNMPASALDKVVTLKVQFCSKGTSRLRSS